MDQLPFHFLTGELAEHEALTSWYDYSLVCTSILISIASSYIAFLTVTRIERTNNKNEQRIWRFCSSLFFGIGIWAMHFVGMLAYNVGIPIGYDIPITLLSILPAVFASYIVVSPKRLNKLSLLARSACMGIGIGSMHYVGMSAMRMDAIMAYDGPLFLLSIVVAIALSGVALTVSDKQRKSQKQPIHLNTVVASIIMGLAISCMHYIGMVSMRVFEGKSQHSDFNGASSNDLINIILLVLIASSAILLFLLEVRARLLISSRLNSVLSSVQEGILNFNDKGEITYANGAAERLFAYQPGQLLDKYIYEVLVNERSDKSAVIHTVTRLITESSGESVTERLSGIKYSGAHFPLLSTFSLMSYDNKEIVCTITDLSDLKKQETFTQAVFDNLPLSIVVKNADNLTFSHVNHAAEKTLGRSKHALLGATDFDLFTKTEASRITQSDTDVIDKRAPTIIEEEPVTIEGETRYITTRKVPLFDPSRADEVGYLLWLSEDVTELRNAKKALLKMNERMSMAADAAQIGFWELDTETNELIGDDWMHKLYAVAESDESTRCSFWTSFLHHEDSDRVRASMQAAIENKTPFNAEFRISVPDAKVRYIKADGQIVGNKMFGICLDITARVLAEKEAERLSRTDALTGLANRNALTHYCYNEISRNTRKGTKLTCIYIDLDKFKPINDTYGHQVGDAALNEVAQRLASTVRETDCVARIGGDEFVIILTEMVTEDDVLQTLARIDHELHSPIVTRGLSFDIGASIGTAQFPEDGKDLDTLLSVADKRMYRNKAIKKCEDKAPLF